MENEIVFQQPVRLFWELFKFISHLFGRWFGGNLSNQYLFGEKHMSESRALYIDLLKKCLLGQIYDSRRGGQIISQDQCVTLLREANEIFKPYLAPLGHTVESFLDVTSTVKMGSCAENLCLTLNGMHRDITPDTMSHFSALENLQFCVEEVIRNNVPGDLIETGVWKGGLPVFMRGILKAYDVVDRVVWAADSYEGLPKADPERSLEDAIWFHLFSPLERLKIPVEFVLNVFQKYGLLDDQVRLLKGVFSLTLPVAPIEKLAVMRLDGDWYKSTMDSLKNLYPKLAPGGFAIIDDYGLPFGCRRAVDEYRSAYQINEPIQWINHQAVFWRKEG